MNENFRQYIKENGHCELPNTITAIDDDAFLNCTELKSIYIPGTVSAIGKTAFKGCTELEMVALQPGLRSIGKGAFFNCTKLSNIVIPGTVDEINEFAFSNCKSIESVKIPSALKVIRMGCFSGCSKLSGIKVPSTVSEIESVAFSTCISLRKAIISNSVKKIGDGIFKGSSSLKVIMLPFKFSTMNEAQRLCIRPDCAISTPSSHSHHSSLNSSRNSSGSSSSLSLGDLKTNQTLDSINTGSFSTNDISLSGLPLPSTTTTMSMHPGDAVGITSDILDTESIIASDRNILFNNMLCDTPKSGSLISKLYKGKQNNNGISPCTDNHNDNQPVPPIRKGSPLNSSDLTGVSQNNFDVNALIDADGVNNIPSAFPITSEKTDVKKTSLSDDSFERQIMAAPVSSSTSAKRKVLRNTKTIYTEISVNEGTCSSNVSDAKTNLLSIPVEKDIDIESSLLSNMNESIVNETVVPVNSITVKKEINQNTIEKTSFEQLNEETKEVSASRSSTPKITSPVMKKQSGGSVYSALSTPVAAKADEPQKRKGGCFKKKK